MKALGHQIQAEKVLPESEHTRFRALAARANYLAADRPDIIFAAKEVCRGCEVRHDCLEFALQNGEKFGIWGGLSERERRRIRRQRAQVARSTIGA